MKRIIYVLGLLFFLLFSCAPIHWATIGNGENMKVEFSDNYTKYQFNSVCNVKKISSDLSDWVSLPLMDKETKSKNYKYMYIQKMDSLEIVYILFIDNDKYNLNKRLTY